jgi:hypothetical protein
VLTACYTWTAQTAPCLAHNTIGSKAARYLLPSAFEELSG